MSVGCDGDRPEFYSETIRRARKEHECSACGDVIPRGHIYSYTIGKWYGDVQTTKRCLRCDQIFEFLMELSDDPVDCALGCGHSYEDIFDDHPPDWILGVVLAPPEELQALWALETGMQRLMGGSA